MGDYHRYGRGPQGGLAAGSAERTQLEIVRGREFSANQMCLAPYRPPRQRSPEEIPVPRAKARSSAGGFGCFGDPEMKRRRRVASYKAYAVEGRFKASIRRGIRWIKNRCSELVHG